MAPLTRVSQAEELAKVLSQMKQVLQGTPGMLPPPPSATLPSIIDMQTARSTNNMQKQKRAPNKSTN